MRSLAPRARPENHPGETTTLSRTRWCAAVPPHTSTDYRCGFVFGSGTVLDYKRDLSKQFLRYDSRANRNKL